MFMFFIINGLNKQRYLNKYISVIRKSFVIIYSEKEGLRAVIKHIIAKQIISRKRKL